MKILRLLLLGVVPFVAACSDDDDAVGSNADSTFQLRVVHVSSDTGAVDVYAEGDPTPLVQGAAYGAASPYLPIPAGTYNIQLRQAGADPASTPVFETGDVPVSAGLKITAAAVGLSNAGAPADQALRVLLLIENFADAGAGNFNARIVHGSADAPTTVGVDVGNDGSSELPSLARFADSGETGVPLPAGQSLQIGIRTTAGGGVTAFTTPAQTAGTEVFIFAAGLLASRPDADDGFQLLALFPDSTTAWIDQNPWAYALHASPDAGTVDIRTGGLELATSVSFGDLAGPIQVPPGAYPLDFLEAGTSNNLVTVTTPALAAGKVYFVVASGLADPGENEEAFGLLAYEEMFAVDGTKAFGNLVHASPDAPPVDVGTTSGGFRPLPDFVDLAYGDQSPAIGTELPLADFTVGVAGTGTTQTVAEFDLALTNAAGLRAFVVAAGRLSQVGNDETFRLLLVSTQVSPWTVTSINPNTPE
ncbi:MAG: DUF4397 domain-containing protein [Planctomycetota bacterium]|jgi:hypothetical protein